MVSSITIAPNQWPTHSVIDWVNVLEARGPMCPSATSAWPSDANCAAACRSGAPSSSSATSRTTYWWWLMQNGDVNTARLMLAVMDDLA